MKLKSYIAILFVGMALLLSSCEDYLDINQNPNNPTDVEAALLLAPIQNQYALGIQFDARYIGRYVQNWQNAALVNDPWDLHGYVPASDAGGELWRNVYWRGGRNLLNLISDAQANQRWDYAGVGLVLQAWGWQMLTDIHGEIILDEAYDLDPNKNIFNYNTQPEVYAKVQQLLTDAIQNLNRADGNVSSVQLARGDQIYKGDRIKWKRFAYGLLAINAHHLSNKKGTYNPDKVMQYVDSSLVSNADDAVMNFNGLSTADASFFGPIRQNMNSFVQSNYVLRLLDGTVTTVKDPRLPIMLVPSLDGVYRGLNPGQGQSTAASAPAASRTVNVWGLPVNVNPPVGTLGRFLFTDKGPLPLMTYAQLQFIKAEAAFIKGDKATALAAYKKGIEAHMSASYVNVSSADRTAFLNNPLVVPTVAANLTLGQIMSQKYIAQWGWGFLEQWADLRRYNYGVGTDAFPTFALPNTFYGDNVGKPVQRLRPRYNSEYVWNIPALTKIGGFDLDFHTKPVWFTQP